MHICFATAHCWKKRYIGCRLLTYGIRILKLEENIPKNLSNLIQLKGVGRKSANVLLREINQSAEGIIVDLHVIRVVARIGITPNYKEGNKIEKMLIQQLPYEILDFWSIYSF